MRLTYWIPGVGHWLLGRRRWGLFLHLMFVSFLFLAEWRWDRMTGAVEHTLDKLSGAKIPYTSVHFDRLFSTFFIAISLIFLVIYSAFSCRRIARLAKRPKEESQGQWTIVWRQFKKNRLAVVGAFLIFVIYLIAILAPMLASYDPTALGDIVDEQELPPSFDHPLGTDRFARDVMSRIIFGSRISLLVGFLAVALAVTIGTLFGAIAGYCGKWVDSIMMRFVDMMLCFPTLILIITIIAIWRNQSIWIIIAVIGVTSWMGVARLVRGEFLLLRELDFYQAARALGGGHTRLIFRHLLPNALTPIIVSSTLRVGTTILVEASLSFLGLGVQPPAPSWGNIIFDTKGNIFSEWWMPLSAGLAISITVIAYNLLGDGLRDALDPRLRE